MASDIQAARFKRLMDKYLHLKGGLKPVALDDIMPVFAVEPPDAAEMALLRNERLGWAGNFIAAQGAGNNGNVSLANPKGSGMLVSVDAITLGNLAGGCPYVVQLFSTGAPTAGFVPGTLSDSRLARATSATQLSVAGTVPAFSVGVPAGTQRLHVTGSGVVPVHFVLAPDGFLTVTGVTANFALDCVAFSFRERDAEVTELTQVGSIA